MYGEALFIAIFDSVFKIASLSKPNGLQGYRIVVYKSGHALLQASRRLLRTLTWRASHTLLLSHSPNLEKKKATTPNAQPFPEPEPNRRRTV